MKIGKIDGTMADAVLLSLNIYDTYIMLHPNRDDIALVALVTNFFMVYTIIASNFNRVQCDHFV